MMTLKTLFDRLNDQEHCKYTENGTYYSYKDDSIEELKAKELLKIGRTFPSREEVIIGSFDNETRVLYLGEDNKSMKKTVEALRLPTSWPTNLGEKIFYVFRSHLRKLNQKGEIGLEQRVYSGKDHQLEFVLKKLLKVYIDSETKYYAASKDTLSGEMLS